MSYKNFEQVNWESFPMTLKTEDVNGKLEITETDQLTFDFDNKDEDKSSP